jgi:hypothetical protein
MRLSGFTGEVRWSYMVAATFGPWTLIDHELSGEVVSVDDYRTSQDPLVVVLRMGRHELSYPVVNLQFTGERISVTLGERKQND